MKIILKGLNAANMGEATEADAAGYREWIAEKMQAEFPGAEVDVFEEDSTYAVEVCDLTDEEELNYNQLRDRVYAFAQYCWDSCPWSWVN